MSDIRPDEPSGRLRSDGTDRLVLDVRNEGEYDDWHVPGNVNVDVHDELTSNPDAATDAIAGQPRGIVPTFERIKRANVDRESVPKDELADLELAPPTAPPSDP
ncbi:MAG: rhodanese-related sulfurtransferase [Halobacteriales archaeon]|jgi:rhodanese-related sulfurtransferase